MVLTQMDVAHISISPQVVANFVEAIQSREPVAGLTHNFYRYPARFSPLVARAAILTFTKPGDVVFDPFVGGGTTLVEARSVGRLKSLVGSSERKISFLAQTDYSKQDA